tara:strand:- start:215 stop:430 length:216 start_codon:yes stop_codon:yes gene_type:complete
MRKDVKHYTIGSIETIDFIKAKLSKEEYIGYLRGNVLKYLSRANYKDSADEDYDKAKVYLNWLIQEQSNKA